MEFQTQRLSDVSALLRLNRPVGIWLLFWPCAWGITLASHGLPNTGLLLLFLAGALCMRSAGCIINDIADRKIDAQVERTRNRPLASGAISLREALLLLTLLLAISLLIVLQLAPVLLYWACGALLLVGLYPLMKRITYWPQAFLGVTFNLGAFFGWIAVRGDADWPAYALYLAGICWTIGYDTIYAHQDIEDDLRIGVKSTAIRFGKHNRHYIAGFYIISWLSLSAAILLAHGGPLMWLTSILAAAHFYWQTTQFEPQNAPVSLKIFKSNATLGGVIALLFWLDRGLFTPF